MGDGGWREWRVTGRGGQDMILIFFFGLRVNVRRKKMYLDKMFV